MLVRWRLAVRVARRDAARHPGRSVLVVGLIALPVALLAAGVTLWATTSESPHQRATAVMGTADAVVEFPDGAAGRVGWRDELPDGVRAVPVDTSRPIGVRDGGERRDLVFTGAVLGDRLTDGLIDLVAGRVPSGVREAAVSAPLLADLDARIGDELALADLDAALVITGIVERPARLSAPDVVVAPGALPGQLDRRRWLIDAGPAGAGAVGHAIGAVNAGTPVDRAVPMLTTRSALGVAETVQLDMLAVLGGLALTEAAIVASAAFAVGVRRQLRALGLVAAAGGRRRDLRRVVLASGLALGAAGALIGAWLGVTAAAVMTPFLDGWLDRRVGGLEVPWQLVAVTMLAGLLAALAAAAAPARTAGQVPVAAALAGTRPVARPRRRGPVIGGVVVALGLAVIAAAAGNARIRMSATPTINAITAGAILVVLGFTFASPTIAGLLGRLAGRAPTGTRLALRDLARHRVRTGPAISAVMAALALPIAVGMFLASANAQAAESRSRLLAPEHIVVEDHPSQARPPTHGPPDDGHPTVVARPADDRVDAVAEAVGATSRVTLTEWRAPGSAHDPYGVSVEVAATVETVAPGGSGRARGQLATVEDAQAALRAWGVDEDERPAATEALESGGLVLFGVQAIHGTVAVIIVDGEEVDHRPVVGVATHPYQDLPWAIATEALADDLGLEAARQSVLLRAEAPPDQDALKAASGAAGVLGRPAPDGSIVGADDDAVLLRFHQPTSPFPGMGLQWIALGVSAAVAAGIVVVALALSAAEGRADRATLAALGADRAMRRRFRAAQALALTLAAGALALPAGLLPASVTLLARQPGYPLRLPWEAMGVALVGLPLLAWAAVRLLASERDDTHPSRAPAYRPE